MPWTDLIYLSERRAQQLGFTHHGRIYGVPCWIAEKGPDQVVACPKITLLQLYAMAASWVFDQFTYFMMEDDELITPLFFGREIPQPEAPSAQVAD